MIRTRQNKWKRYNTSKNKELNCIIQDGISWYKQYKNNAHDVFIESDFLKLAGIYFDFGNNKCVIIIAGRKESCMYCCHYAEPYRKAGYNVLVIDNRAHGNSEGKYSTAGYKEYKDILKWAQFLNESEHINQIVFHGICVGAATALYAVTSYNCPDYVTGMIADGMFTTFRQSFKNHLISYGIPAFPATNICMYILSKISGTNAFRIGPITEISKNSKPILFLAGKNDKFSRPEEMMILYEYCNSIKKIVWFNKGKHSRLRINNTAEYDNAIFSFL